MILKHGFIWPKDCFRTFYDVLMRNYDKSIQIFCVFSIFGFGTAELNSKSPAAAARRGVRRAPRRVPPRGFATLHFMPFDKVEDLEKYSDMTHGTIFQCNLSSMGVKDLMIDKASRNLARTIGFTQVLRATRFYGMNGHVGIPLDLCKGHKVRLNTLIISRRNPEFKTSKEIEELVFDLSSRAVGYLTKTRTQYQILDPDVRKLFIGSTSGSDLWLNKLEKVQWDIFDERLMEKQNELTLDMAHKFWIKKSFKVMNFETNK